MALKLKINICKSSDCKKISMSELTSTYLSEYNEGGYGAPNPGIVNVTAATLEVTTPSNFYTIDLLNNGYGFPCDNPFFSWDIPMELVGLTEGQNIPDGYYIFKYKITASGNDYEVTSHKLFYCSIDRCINNLLAKLQDNNCDCCNNNSKEFEHYQKVWVFLEALKMAAKCGDISKFSKIKKVLDKLCLTNKCKDC